jgi:hypothetical protein
MRCFGYQKRGAEDSRGGDSNENLEAISYKEFKDGAVNDCEM